MNRKLIAAPLILFIFSLDRLTKSLAFSRLYPDKSIPVTPFFYLTYVENSGAAFGMLGGRNTLFIAVSIALIALLLLWLRKWPPKDALGFFSVAAVLGGAVGNLYDRIAYGFVVDFMDFRFWPVFNVADSCISVGSVLLLISLNWTRAERP
ncbi:MAG: signal peptidase II [Elusimicrobia bacterium]|nr:signal peptidase II [Elusimicrobiota bacterium]